MKDQGRNVDGCNHAFAVMKEHASRWQLRNQSDRVHSNKQSKNVAHGSSGIR